MWYDWWREVEFSIIVSIIYKNKFNWVHVVQIEKFD